MSSSQNLPFHIPTKAPEIWTPSEVIRYVKTGMVVELSTIPLYLYALYSIKPQSEGMPARAALRAVVQQEMLHLAMTGNLLSSLNGSMDLYDSNIIPKFPDTILYSKIPMTLARANKQSLENFLQIEGADYPRPTPDNEEHGLLPDIDAFKVQASLGILDTYNSIGDFYEDLEKGLRALPDSDFSHNMDKQFSGMDFFGGQMVVITDRSTALDAINIVVEQGEGNALVANSHYTVFTNLYLNRKSWELYDVPTNPKTTDYVAGHYVNKLSLAFDAGYCYLLQTIQRVWETGRENDKIQLRLLLLQNIRAIMTTVLTPLAGVLVKQPFRNGCAAPCFNFYPLKYDGAPGAPMSPDKLYSMLSQEVIFACHLATVQEERDLLKKMATYIFTSLKPNPS